VAIHETIVLHLPTKSSTYQLCKKKHMKNLLPILLISLAQCLTAQNDDCATAIKLCNKNTLQIPSSFSAGQDPTELDLSTCFIGGVPGPKEINSTWFTWKCVSAGNFTFVASPINPETDLDFVLFKLPNNNCNNKLELRCMAAGDLTAQSVCMGPTGLLIGDPDLNGLAGCLSVTNNNFLAPIQMQVNETYALCMINYSGSGGFTLSFGGNAEIGCSPSSSKESEQQIFSIYPNPAFDILHIKSEKRYASLSLFSIDGRKMQEYAYSSLGQYNSSSLPRGAYLLVLEDEANRAIARKMVILMDQD
jgi:hypothetical protein